MRRERLSYPDELDAASAVTTNGLMYLDLFAQNRANLFANIDGHVHSENGAIDFLEQAARRKIDDTRVLDEPAGEYHDMFDEPKGEYDDLRVHGRPQSAFMRRRTEHNAYA